MNSSVFRGIIATQQKITKTVASLEVAVKPNQMSATPQNVTDI